MLHPHPVDRLVGEIDVEDVVGLADIGLDRLGVLIERRMPLVAVAAEEAIKMFEAQSGGPKIEWTCLTRHPVWHIVHLAEPCGVVAIVLQDCGDRTGALGHQRIIAGIAGREFRDVSAGNGMMVSPGDQRRPCWGAQGRRVVHVVAKPGVCDALEIRSLDRSAEGAACPEADVVGQDQEDVGRACRRLDALWKVRNGTLHGAFDLALKWRFGSRQY